MLGRGCPLAAGERQDVTIRQTRWLEAQCSRLCSAGLLSYSIKLIGLCLPR